jgi:hypothetical protein
VGYVGNEREQERKRKLSAPTYKMPHIRDCNVLACIKMVRKQWWRTKVERDQLIEFFLNKASSINAGSYGLHAPSASS